MNIRMQFTSPLFTDWTPQYVRLRVPGLPVGAPAALAIDGTPAAFQYTGMSDAEGAEVLVRLGFAAGETKTLVFTDAAESATDLQPREISLEEGTKIGYADRQLTIPAPVVLDGKIAGPFAGYAGFPLESTICCTSDFLSASLQRTNAGPHFLEYQLEYRFADNRSYRLAFRCYQAEPAIEVAETLALGMDARLELMLNPADLFDRIVSRESFEGEPQPDIEPLGEEHPRDVLCRLQMPVLSEYFIPNNRGWFAFFNETEPARGMLGILGLYGGQWTRAVENIMEVLDHNGKALLHASLNGGTRYWMLYAGPLETMYVPEQRLVFHRLHAEWNALRLDEHLDLTGQDVYDATCWDQPGFFGRNYRAKAHENVKGLPLLQQFLEQWPAERLSDSGGYPSGAATLHALLEPKPEYQRSLYTLVEGRFAKWVKQFQGYRTGENDYGKNVIGFSRILRGLLIAYELLRKDEALSAEEIGRFNAFFAFAARRILDEGRWPHSHTWQHPDHPDSTRDLYTYGGEHRPDRLVWTNCLPNFQSDPICALLQLSALIPDHPDADAWRTFALDDLDRQLDAYCGKSGAWEESINYALYTLSYFIITFRVLKNRCGIDYFQDARMRRYAGWLTRFLGPLDKRWDKYTFPGIGNAVCPSGGGQFLLAYAGELPEDDPLRADLIAAYQRLEASSGLTEHYPTVLAVMATVPDHEYPQRPLESELMDELGVTFRHAHPSPTESYLVQKIGFWKDHYEADETAFNWYAKGTPLLMDYGTYTGDAGTWGAHNVVEIPDADPLRRGYLADHLFSPSLDYTRCEVPVTLKLMWGHVRTFAEVDNKDGIIDRTKTPYFYIGDNNPVGPKTWRVRQLLYVKPDYLVVYDRIFGAVPHRFNLHVTGEDIRREGQLIRATGRFDLDLLCYVQNPSEFEMETGLLVPGPERYGANNPHRQSYFRLYNLTGDSYRTALFAQERDRAVTIESCGASGMKIATPEYTDYVFVSDTKVCEQVGDVQFIGKVGWIRHDALGEIRAVMADGERIQAFGVTISGRGPWTYNADGSGQLRITGTPRPVKIERSSVAVNVRESPVA